jgi:membrane protein required for colicin V production
MPTFFDLLLIIAISGFGLFGLWFGLLHTLGSLIGTVLGVYLASRYYEPVSRWVVDSTGWGENISIVVIFAIAFVVINRLVGLLFWILNKIFRVVTRLPFMQSLNRIAGLAFGLIEGLITIGFVAYFALRFPFSDRLTDALETSSVAPIALDVIERMLPLIPDATRAIQTTFDYVL